MSCQNLAQPSLDFIAEHSGQREPQGRTVYILTQFAGEGMRLLAIRQVSRAGTQPTLFYLRRIVLQ